MKNVKIRNIIICGFMGTGKSSVGKKLASMTGYHFLDMDAAIEEHEGMSIPDIFSTRGESAFRALETEMVKKIAGMERRVIATGGGTVVNPDNLCVLKSCGVVVNLTASVPVIIERIGSGHGRPMLHDGDRIERVTSLLKKRESAYAQADIACDTSQLNIEGVAREILSRLRESGFTL
ncbi:MAG TPA: shikimate kinase [Acidobacteriota bacterium]|nr:shikimate kinase [Acidobacteriota bacterium]